MRTSIPFVPFENKVTNCVSATTSYAATEWNTGWAAALWSLTPPSKPATTLRSSTVEQIDEHVRTHVPQRTELIVKEIWTMFKCLHRRCVEGQIMKSFKRQTSTTAPAWKFKKSENKSRALSAVELKIFFIFYMVSLALASVHEVWHGRKFSLKCFDYADKNLSSFFIKNK